MTAKKTEPFISGMVEIPRNEAVLLLEAGYLLMEMGKLDAAREVFGGVESLMPKSDVPCVALGNLYFSQGKFEMALSKHKEALTRDPKSALAQSHIGEVLLFQKKFKLAVAALKKAMRMDPNGVTAIFASELLNAHKLAVFS